MKTCWAAIGVAAMASVLFAAVKTDYSHHANFSQYHSYSWIKAQAGTQLWADRIQRDVDQQLQAKGWRRVDSGGDAAVSAFGATKNQQTLQTFYDGLGGGWFWSGFGDEGMSTTTVENTPVGTLVVDIFDAHSKKLVWRGSSTHTITGDAEKNAKKLEKDVADLFKQFPPHTKESTGF